MSTKHLFYISNYVSFNNYLSIILNEKIDLSDCFFYSPRTKKDCLNTSLPLNFIHLPPVYQLESKYNLLKIFAHEKQIYQFRNSLNKQLKNKKFILYLPHLINFREKIIVSSSNCQNYFFVEEGLPAYRNDFQLDNANKIEKIGPLSNYKNKLSGTFGNHSLSFQQNDFTIKKIEFPLSFTNEFKTIVAFDLKNGDHVIAVDSPQAFENSSNYLLSFLKLLEYLRNENVTELHLKFHPDFQSNEPLAFFMKELVFSMGFNAKEISNTVYLEEVMSHGIKLNLYCIASSLLIYAGLFESNVFIFDTILKERDKKYKEVKPILENTIKKLGINVHYLAI